MRFPVICAAAALAAGPALADSYETGLGTISDTVAGDGGAVMVIGSAVAELGTGGEVSATVLVDGEPCARSARDGVTGIASAKASCLVMTTAGATHEVTLIESHTGGLSKRSTLRTRAVEDPTAPGTLLGEASGSASLGVTVATGAPVTLALSADVTVAFAESETSITGKAGMGSIEATYDAGAGPQLCFEGAFNQFGGIPDEMSCTIEASGDAPVRIGMATPVAAGAEITLTSLRVRVAE